jgi:hypothetical protein
MKVIDKGHEYLLQNNKTLSGGTGLTFFKDATINSNGYAGTTNQEVLRALIDRVKFLDKQVPHAGNQDIIYHLRQALILHEMRHLQRLVDKGEAVELIKINKNGHFI